MRRLWMTAAGLLLLAACRSEGTHDQALGTERKYDQDRVGAYDPLRAGEQAKMGDVTKDRDTLSTHRILAALQEMNRAEVEMGTLAQQKATSQQVKDFAAKLVEEHNRNIEAIDRITKSKGIDLSMSGIGDDPILTARKDAAKEELKKLQGLSGQAFDATFMTAQPGHHTMFIELADEGQRLSKDADVQVLFRNMVSQGHDHSQKALAAIPQSCGGQEAAGWTSPGVDQKQQQGGKQQQQQGDKQQGGSMVQPGQQGGQQGGSMNQPGQQGGQQGGQDDLHDQHGGQPGQSPGSGNRGDMKHQSTPPRGP